MSVKTQTRVWEMSKQRGSRRFLLIAIADNADDNGESFVGIQRLAKKMAVSTRTVQRLVEELSHTDELAVIWRGGKLDKNSYYTNYYYILTGRSEAEIRRIKEHVAHANEQDPMAQSIREAGKRGPEAHKSKNGDKMTPIDGDKVTPLFEPPNDNMVTFPAKDGDIAMSPRLLTIKSPSEEMIEIPSDSWDKQKKWEAVLLQLRMQMSRPNYQSYVKPLTLDRFDEGELILVAPNEFSRGWVETRLGKTIQRLVSGITGHDCEIQFILVNGRKEGSDEHTPG